MTEPLSPTMWRMLRRIKQAHVKREPYWLLDGNRTAGALQRRGMIRAERRDFVNPVGECVDWTLTDKGHGATSR